jgi:fumarylacetoacetase
VSWVPGAAGHPEFPVQNLPFAIFRQKSDAPRPGVAIGEWILDLSELCAAGLLDRELRPALSSTTLNSLFALTVAAREALRLQLSDLLCSEASRAAVEPLLRPSAQCRLLLPFAVGDYTDFYSGIHHATNVGKLFRPDAPLLPNYKYVPIGYHGRASSVRPSGDPVVRANGQRRLGGETTPSFGPSRQLDYELELGLWIGSGNPQGKPISIAEADDHIAGFCLLNDWSARDIQAWEYQPLGPFLAKSFHSTISAWVITPEALEPFRIAQPARPDGNPRPLEYLWSTGDQSAGARAIELEVSIQTARMRKDGWPPHELSRGLATNMYWTFAQLITHHASNGCNLRSGDLLGSGTISAPTADGFGSLLEITRGGVDPIHLATGETRTFLADGDEIILSAKARREGYVSIGFGDCRAVVHSSP